MADSCLFCTVAFDESMEDTRRHVFECCGQAMCHACSLGVQAMCPFGCPQSLSIQAGAAAKPAGDADDPPTIAPGYDEYGAAGASAYAFGHPVGDGAEADSVRDDAAADGADGSAGGDFVDVDADAEFARRLAEEDEAQLRRDEEMAKAWQEEERAAAAAAAGAARAGGVAAAGGGKGARGGKGSQRGGRPSASPAATAAAPPRAQAAIPAAGGGGGRGGGAASSAATWASARPSGGVPGGGGGGGGGRSHPHYRPLGSASESPAPTGYPASGSGGSGAFPMWPTATEAAAVAAAAAVPTAGALASPVPYGNPEPHAAAAGGAAASGFSSGGAGGGGAAGGGLVKVFWDVENARVTKDERMSDNWNIQIHVVLQALKMKLVSLGLLPVDPASGFVGGRMDVVAYHSPDKALEKHVAGVSRRRVDELVRNGVELRDVGTKGGAADVALKADVEKCLELVDHYGLCVSGIVVISGDSDFLHMYQAIARRPVPIRLVVVHRSNSYREVAAVKDLRPGYTFTLPWQECIPGPTGRRAGGGDDRSPPSAAVPGAAAASGDRYVRITGSGAVVEPPRPPGPAYVAHPAAAAPAAAAASAGPTYTAARGAGSSALLGADAFPTLADAHGVDALSQAAQLQLWLASAAPAAAAGGASGGFGGHPHHPHVSGPALAALDSGGGGGGIAADGWGVPSGMRMRSLPGRM